MYWRRKIFFWGFLASTLYVLSSYHFVHVGEAVRVLKKSRCTFQNTFVSALGKSNNWILSIDELREDGIAELLVEVGRMTEEEKLTLMEIYREG